MARQAGRAGVPVVLFVSGAPGAGKSVIVEELLAAGCDALVFDGDWLLEAASELAGRSIVEAQETWPGYGAVWMRFLAMLGRNRRTAAYFRARHRYRNGHPSRHRDPGARLDPRADA